LRKRFVECGSIGLPGTRAVAALFDGPAFIFTVAVLHSRYGRDIGLFYVERGSVA
jgi:hypothetical protein